MHIIERDSFLQQISLFFDGRLAMNENEYQAKLIKDIEKRIPGSMVLKQDPNIIQGIPDLAILYKDKFAILEVKKSANEKYQPNQEYYLKKFGEHVYSKTIYPENEKEILNGLESALRT